MTDDERLGLTRVVPAPRARRTCGKACFTSERAAKHSIRGADSFGRGQRWKGRASAYFCKGCAAWHVGHHEE